VVTAQNGIPWWYFRKCSKDSRDSDPVRRPDGIVEANIEVVASSAAWFIQRLSWLNRVSCGILKVTASRLVVDGSKTERIQLLSNLEQGVKAPVRTRIRSDIWVAVGNLAFNPISALTRNFKTFASIRLPVSLLAI